MSTEHWYVLIEEQVGYGNAIRWQLTQTTPARDRQHALEVAGQAAYNYRPANPYSEQQRSLFRTPEGSWVVNVQGLTASFHFRTTVAEYINTFPSSYQA